MILSGKRGASSPAETEKKKSDKKSTPVEEMPSSRPVPVQSQGMNEGWTDGQGVNETDTNQEGWRLQVSPKRGRGGGFNSPIRQLGPSPSSPNRSFSEVASHGARRFPDQSKPPGPNPDFLHKHTHPCFRMRNEGAFRDEIEIETRTINGEPFRGTITRKEGKHRIYKEIIGGPLSNVRGVRFGFKNVPTVVIMLKEPINIDDLESIQEFDFKRRYTIKDRRTGEEKQMEDTIGCKIRGVRTVTGSEASIPYSEDWRRVVKIEGCDYRVEESTIISFLENY